MKLLTRKRTDELKDLLTTASNYLQTANTIISDIADADEEDIEDSSRLINRLRDASSRL